MKAIMSAAFAALLLVGSAPIAQASAQTVGSTVEAEISAMGLTVPLPEGRWEVVDRRDRGRRNLDTVVLRSVTGGVVDRLVYVAVARSRSGSGFDPFPHCHDPVYSHVVAGKDVGTECWHVRPVSFGTAGSPSDTNKLLRALATRNGEAMPLTMIGVRFQRSDANVKLVAEYYWHPDLLAPAPGGRRWRPEDWYRTAIAGDPVRNAVAGVVARWGEAWQPRIAAAFSAAH